MYARSILQSYVHILSIWNLILLRRIETIYFNLSYNIKCVLALCFSKHFISGDFIVLTYRFKILIVFSKYKNSSLGLSINITRRNIYCFCCQLEPFLVVSSFTTRFLVPSNATFTYAPAHLSTSTRACGISASEHWYGTS